MFIFDDYSECGEKYDAALRLTLSGSARVTSAAAMRDGCLLCGRAA
jgi:hypothetical protein